MRKNPGTTRPLVPREASLTVKDGRRRAEAALNKACNLTEIANRRKGAHAYALNG